MGFINYFENREAGLSVRSAAKAKFPERVVIGGFVPGGDAFSLFEAEEKNVKSKFNRIEVLFDDEDIKYLYQFPFELWGDAQYWRYNEGLARWCFKDEVENTYNKNPNFEHLFEKMTKLGYDLPRFKGKSETTEGWKFDADSKLFNTQNYQSVRPPAMKNSIADWVGGIVRGFLPATGEFTFFPEGGKKGGTKSGRPWDVSKRANIVVSNRGIVVTMGKKLIIPATPDMLKQMGVEVDPSGMVAYEGHDARSVPLLTPGRMFVGSVIQDASDAELRIGQWFNANAIHRFQPGGDLADKMIITGKELNELGMPDQYKELFELAQAKIEAAGKKESQITPEELLDLQQRTGKGVRGVNVSGGYNPVYNSPMEVQASDAAIKNLATKHNIAMNRKHYDTIIDTFFVEDVPWDWSSESKTSLSPLGVVESPVSKGVKMSRNYLKTNLNDQWRPGSDGYPAEFVDDMEQTKEPELMDKFKKEKLQHAISGTDNVVDFVDKFINYTKARFPATGLTSGMLKKTMESMPQGEEKEDLQTAWKTAASVIMTHAQRFAARSYQAEAKQLGYRQKSRQLKGQSKQGAEFGFGTGEEGETLEPTGIDKYRLSGRKEYKTPVRDIRSVRGTSIPVGQVFKDISKTIEKHKQLQQSKAAGQISPEQAAVTAGEIKQQVQTHDQQIQAFVQSLAELRKGVNDPDVRDEFWRNLGQLKRMAPSDSKMFQVAKGMATKAGVTDQEWDAA